MNDFPIMTERDALRHGYASLTRPYAIDSSNRETRERETEWWDRMCDDMKGCKCVVVQYAHGWEMWRHTDELDIDPITGKKITDYLPKKCQKKPQSKP
jgi:hypothetical protein